MNKEKRKISVHQVFIIVHMVSVVLTLIPNAGASKPCRLGYYALCSFTPYSTLILLALAGLHTFLFFQEKNKTKS